MIPVIICGGVGTKMWPASRQRSPKHFLPLIGDKSLFEMGWVNLRQRYKPGQIYLQTNAVQAGIARKIVPEICEENIFIEPEMRNQGPATGFAAAQLIKRGLGDEPFILVQADVLREPGDMFLKMMETMDGLARSSTNYLTGGISPKSIVRGVDYLVKGEMVSDNGGVRVFRVEDYIDRSEEEKIKQYLGSDKLLLHANHSSMTPHNLLSMYKKYRQEWYEPLMEIIKGADISIEYAKMPKALIEEVTKVAYKNGEAMVVELPFEWIDFGTWESLDKYLKEKKLYQSGSNEIDLDSNNNFVKAPGGKEVAMIGVDNLVVVDTGDALLICRKDLSGRVGEVVEKLKVENRLELL